MKRKVISFVSAIFLLTCGVLIMYGVSKRPEGSTSSTGNINQQMAASEKAGDQNTSDETVMSEEMSQSSASQKTEEATAAPTATPEATKQPEASKQPTATKTPEATKQPEATAAPTATPEATEEPKTTAAPTATPEATKQPEASAAPTATESPAQVHTCTWDGGSVTQAATCSSEGVKTYTCTSCGKTRTESIAKTDHSYVTETTPATCTEYGQDRTYCSVCGYEKSRTANSDAPKGHQATDYRLSFGSKGSTCTHPGTYDIYCGVCGACVQREVPREPLGHDLQNPEVVQPARCNTVEITQFTCGRCGETIRQQTRDTDSNNHEWEEGIENRYNWETDEYDQIPYRRCRRCPAKEYY